MWAEFISEKYLHDLTFEIQQILQATLLLVQQNPQHQSFQITLLSVYLRNSKYKQ